MNSIFNYMDYRLFLIDYFKNLPKQGYGQLRKWSEYLNVHTTLSSQILKGHKNITTDQAVLTAEFIRLTDYETDYFVLLVQWDRAGNVPAKKHYKKQLLRIKQQAQDISNRVSSAAKLNEQQRAIFYSDWAYTAIRQTTAIARMDDVHKISSYLNLPTNKVQKCLEFLLQNNLCIMDKNKLSVGPASTHLESSSPWVRTHHTNWREKAIQSCDYVKPSDLHYTAPMTLAIEDVEKIREMLINSIEQINKIVDPSESQTLACLNIDLFVI